MCCCVFVQFRNGAEYVYSHCAETMRLSVQPLRRVKVHVYKYTYMYFPSYSTESVLAFAITLH